MRALLALLLLLPPAAARAADKGKGEFVPYVPPSRIFTCEIPADWSAFDQETPWGFSAHVLGPALAEGSLRAAFHVHLFEKHKPGFTPLNEMMARVRGRDAATDRESTPASALRAAKKTAKAFEVRETRMLPRDRLPATPVTLHHFYAVLPSRGQDYFLIKLSTTEKDYLDYRELFKRFVRSFRE